MSTPETPTAASKTYTASCHCNRFRYTVEVSPPLEDPACEVVNCNCSICERNGYLIIYVKDEAVNFEKGSMHDFSTYSFASHKVHHYFCGTCGTSCMVKSQDAAFMPGMTIINVRAFQDVDLKALNLKPMDGKSYNSEK